MNRGYVKTWRKTLDKGWIRNHKLWAFWSWCLLKATYRERDVIIGRQVIHLMPGQFIFGRKKAAEETGLTEQEIRTIIAFLKKSENLTIKSTNKFSIITIINWNTYQEDNFDDQPSDQQTTNQQLTTNKKDKNVKNKKPPEKIISEISELRERYSDQETINQVFQAISSTRKSNRIADNVKLSILQSWERYPVNQVMEGIRKYLSREYHNQGKNEKYLLGIIRNENSPQEYKGATPGPMFESSGSPLLDAVRRGEIKPVIGGQA